jgi:hypothetical protein
MTIPVVDLLDSVVSSIAGGIGKPDGMLSVA